MSKYPRTARKLIKAERMLNGPFEPRGLKGRAAEGIRFQKRVHETVENTFQGYGEILDNPWYRYTDHNGSHWCQPDSLLLTHNRAIIIESKLSLRRLHTAIKQLTALYRPVVEHIYKKPAVLLIAFKYWVPGAEINTIEELNELLFLKTPQPAPVGWHLL